jgi:hypothetical protein
VGGNEIGQLHKQHRLARVIVTGLDQISIGR